MSILPKMLSKAFIDVDDEDLDFNDTPQSAAPKTIAKVIEISTTEIIPNPNQPRQHFDIEELTRLAKSISQNGIIQPLTVRKGENAYEIVSGERRLRAAKIAGLKAVPCILISADSEKSAALALIENIQRADLNFFEEAAGISKLINNFSLTQEEVAVKLGLAQSTVANKLRLLRLNEREQKIILDNKLTERHARALLKIFNEKKREDILNKAVQNHWKVDQLEKYIASLEREEIKQDSYKKRAVMLKDIRLFFNTINKAVNVIKLAGVNADTKRVNHDDYIEYIIKIPASEVNIPDDISDPESDKK